MIRAIRFPQFFLLSLSQFHHFSYLPSDKDSGMKPDNGLIIKLLRPNEICLEWWRWAWFWKNAFLHHPNQRCIWSKRLPFLLFRGSLLCYADYGLSLWSERISSCLVWKIDYSCTAAVLAWKGVSPITLSSILMSLHDYLVVYVDYIVITGVQWYNSLEID